MTQESKNFLNKFVNYQIESSNHAPKVLGFLEYAFDVPNEKRNIDPMINDVVLTNDGFIFHKSNSFGFICFAGSWVEFSQFIIEILKQGKFSEKELNYVKENFAKKELIIA